jgi:CDGSH-type Zn-finger protein
MADDVKITPSDNGPYLVRGPMKLVDAEGNEFDIKRKMIALCRCGGSENKPFCDGTHAKIGFSSVVRTPKLDEE